MAIVFALKSSAMYSCQYVFDEKNHYSIEQKLDTCTHTVMPGSIEMSNYYFHQISSFSCFNVLCCINHWWHLPIAGDPVMTRLLSFLMRMHDIWVRVRFWLD